MMFSFSGIFSLGSSKKHKQPRWKSMKHEGNVLFTNIIAQVISQELDIWPYSYSVIGLNTKKYSFCLATDTVHII